MTSKGQITLPKALREMLGLRFGDRVAFSVDPKTKETATLRRKQTLTVDEVAGMLHRPGMRTVSIEEMHEAVGEGICERYERSRR